MILKKVILIISLFGKAMSYGSPPPPPPPPCNTPQCSSGTFCYSNTNQCTPCPAGYKYLSNPNVGVSSTELWGCEICPTGTFSPDKGSSECISCPIGKYAPNKGLTSCFDCDSNTFSDKKGQDSCSVCSKCEDSKYEVEHCSLTKNTHCENCKEVLNCAHTPTCSTSSDSKCESCLSEYYLLSSDRCISTTKCVSNLEYEINSYSITTNRVCDKCINNCPAGQMLDGICIGTSNPTCISCSDGFYKALDDSSSCLSCIKMCDPGFQLKNICSKTTNSICLPCQDGFYKSLSDNSKCLSCKNSCEIGFELNHPCFSTQNPLCIPCQDGFYKSLADGSKCLPCRNSCETGFELNHPCSPDKNPECIPCQDGFYKSLVDGSKCLPCRNSCETGFELNHLCSPDKNPECIPCQDGFYKYLADGSKCLPCNDDCGEGSYIAEVCNLKSNSKCSFCPKNTENPNHYSLFISSCIPCKDGSTSVIGSASCIQCPLGTATFGGIDCKQCAPGTYTDNLGSIECKLCPAGTFSNVISSNTINNCIACDDGFFSLAGNEICIPCPTGTREDGKHLNCNSCLSGEYNDLLGQSFCKKCPAGTENGNIKSITIDSCIKCLPGFFSHGGITKCLQCPPGTSSNQHGTENCKVNLPGTYTSVPGTILPIDCSPGSYSDIHGATKCTLCKSGYMNTKHGSSNINECISCSVGTYSNISGSTFCYDTPKGTYQDKNGQNSTIPCPVGTSNNNIGSIDKSFCELCSPGKYQSNIGSHTCIECSMGFYQNISGQTKCIHCPIGTYNEKLGINTINDCISCEKGTYSSILSAITSDTCLISPIGTYVDIIGSPNYKHCEPGYYQNKIKQSICIACPAGKYNSLYKSTNSSACIDSPIGHFVQNNGSSIFLPCKTGEFSNEIGVTKCNLCKPGKFSDGIASTSCKFCPSNTYSLGSGFSLCDTIGKPEVLIHNITQTSYSVRVNTNFTSVVTMNYVCSDDCSIYVNNNLIIEDKKNENVSKSIVLRLRLGIDTISIKYKDFFNSSLKIDWKCSKENVYTQCYGIPDNIVILSATMETKKNSINTYANPDILFSSIIAKYAPSQTYNFQLVNLEPSVKYTFKLLFKIVNETFPMEPIIIKDITTRVGVPTGPVQELVKYFIGLTPSEHITNEQSKLKIHWDAPLVVLQHGPITSYNISYIREQRQYITYGPNVRTIIVPSVETHMIVNTTTIILDNLNPDTNYIIRVFPRTNAIGQGPENIIRLKTSVAAPPKPPVLNIISITDEDIKVSWPSLTNETGEITKVWIVVEPYERLQVSSEVVHIPKNSLLPFLPFPHEGIRGFFAPYNVSNTCQSHIVGFTFLSVNTKEICGGFCSKTCEYGTEMLDPTTILPTNDKGLENDKFIMVFNNSDGVLSTRYVPYLTMKKRIDSTTSLGGLNSGGTFLIGDGLNNIKSKLNNALLEKELLYRLRFMVFTSETLYSISDTPVEITLVENNSIISLSEGIYLAIILGIGILLLSILCCYCINLIQRRKREKNKIDNSDIVMESITHKNLESYNNSNTTPSFANPLYWRGQQGTQQNHINESTYMDVSIPNVLPEYSSIESIHTNNTYFDVDAPPLPDKKNKTYLDTSDDAPPLPEKENKYLDVVKEHEYDTIEYI